MQKNGRKQLIEIVGVSLGEKQFIRSERGKDPGIDD